MAKDKETTDKNQETGIDILCEEDDLDMPIQLDSTPLARMNFSQKHQYMSSLRSEMPTLNYEPTNQNYKV